MPFLDFNLCAKVAENIQRYIQRFLSTISVFYCAGCVFIRLFIVEITMCKKFVLCVSAIGIWLFLPSLAQADYQKIVHADGRVEYRQGTSSKAAPQRKLYKYRNAQGVVSFTDRQPINFSYELVRLDCYACKLGTGINWETTPLFKGRYEELIQEVAYQYGVSPALVKAVIHAESAFNPQARSKAGAQGLMQLMPATAKELGVRSAFDPEQNIDGGVRYLAILLKRFNYDVRLATAAYNAGPGAVSRYNGVPNFAETKAYVERVAILARRYGQEG